MASKQMFNVQRVLGSNGGFHEESISFPFFFFSVFLRICFVSYHHSCQRARDVRRKTYATVTQLRERTAWTSQPRSRCLYRDMLRSTRRTVFLISVLFEVGRPFRCGQVSHTPKSLPNINSPQGTRPQRIGPKPKTKRKPTSKSPEDDLM